MIVDCTLYCIWTINMRNVHKVRCQINGASFTIQLYFFQLSCSPTWGVSLILVTTFCAPFLLQERRLCAHPFLELYRDGEIQFIVPLARQGDFYVPEVRQAERKLSEQEEFHSDTDISGTLSFLYCGALAQIDVCIFVEFLYKCQKCHMAWRFLHEWRFGIAGIIAYFTFLFCLMTTTIFVFLIRICILG